MIARASAISFWFTPQRLATFFSHLWWTFMLHSAQKTKSYQTSSCLINFYDYNVKMETSSFFLSSVFFPLVLVACSCMKTISWSVTGGNSIGSVGDPLLICLGRGFTRDRFEKQSFFFPLLVFILHIKDVPATSRTPESWRSTPSYTLTAAVFWFLSE